VVTQHAITTQHIRIFPSNKTAFAAEVTSYFTGKHFGQGKWEGREVTAWGKYTDELLGHEQKNGRRLWRIERREVSFMGRMGEEMVMDGE